LEPYGFFILQDGNVRQASHVYLNAGKVPNRRSQRMPPIDHKKFDAVIVGVLDLLRLSDPVKQSATTNHILTSDVVRRTIVEMSDSSPGSTTS